MISGVKDNGVISPSVFHSCHTMNDLFASCRKISAASETSCRKSLCFLVSST